MFFGRFLFAVRSRLGGSLLLMTAEFEIGERPDESEDQCASRNKNHEFDRKTG